MMLNRIMGPDSSSNLQNLNKENKESQKTTTTNQERKESPSSLPYRSLFDPYQIVQAATKTISSLLGATETTEPPKAEGLSKRHHSTPFFPSI